jgi:hypothetical protein
MLKILFFIQILLEINGREIMKLFNYYDNLTDVCILAPWSRILEKQTGTLVSYTLTKGGEWKS